MTTIQMFFKRLKARIPEELPRTSESMDRFISDTLATYDLPSTLDYKRAVAKAIHGLSQATHKAPKSHFYAHLRRFEAMRAAVLVVTDLEKQSKAATPPKGDAVVGQASPEIPSS